MYLTFIIICIFCTCGCSKKEPESITIGAILPLSGDIASYGKNAKKGIELALDEINSNEQSGIKIKVDFQDGEGDAKTSVNIMNKFSNIDKYPVVIGAAASSVSLAIAPVANRNQVVQISPISSSPELTIKGGDYFFRVCPSDAFQAVILAKWMRELNIETVGVLFVNNSWGASLKKQFVDEFQSFGGKVSGIESTDEGDRDFRTQLAKLIADKPDAIYCPTYGKEGGVILKQVRELGYKNQIFGSDVWSSPELITSAGVAAEGVKIVKPAQYEGEAFKVFRNAFLAKYEVESDVYSAYSYDITMILWKAILAGKTDGRDIREYLLNMPLHSGTTGETKFDENGDCNSKEFSKIFINNGIHQIIN